MAKPVEQQWADAADAAARLAVANASTRADPVGLVRKFLATLEENVDRRFVAGETTCNGAAFRALTAAAIAAKGAPFDGIV